MNNPTPFAPVWMGVDLTRYRPCDGTYCFYEYQSLPPLSPAAGDGTFVWLNPLPSATDQQLAVHRPAPEKRAQQAEKLERLTQAAGALNLVLSEPFLRLMGDLELQQRVPSCTACYFDLPEAFSPSPAGEGGYLLRFLNDQQDVLLWYLYLHPSGAQAVVVSSYLYDAEPIPDEYRQGVINSTGFCAASFEEFIYRFWIENTIWFVLADGQGELTEAMQTYLKHYSANQSPDT